MSLIWSHYNVKQREREPVTLRPKREITGKELLKFWGSCVLLAVYAWLLLVVWPLLERGSR